MTSAMCSVLLDTTCMRIMRQRTARPAATALLGWQPQAAAARCMECAASSRGLSWVPDIGQAAAYQWEMGQEGQQGWLRRGGIAQRHQQQAQPILQLRGAGGTAVDNG
jgi:hypothetical protein